MTQYKDGTVQWYPGNMSLAMRKLLYKLFPVFCVDTRFISLQDWNDLWEIISDCDLMIFKGNISCYILLLKYPLTHENTKFVAGELSLKVSLVLYLPTGHYEP